MERTLSKANLEISNTRISLTFTGDPQGMEDQGAYIDLVEDGYRNLSDAGLLDTKAPLF